MCSSDNFKTKRVSHCRIKFRNSIFAENFIVVQLITRVEFIITNRNIDSAAKITIQFTKHVNFTLITLFINSK